jgi:hypothetical protein
MSEHQGDISARGPRTRSRFRLSVSERCLNDWFARIDFPRASALLRMMIGTLLLPFRSIMLPLMTPALVTSSIFGFIWTWNDFFGPLLYLKDPDLYTLPIALRLFVDQSSGSDYGAQMAMAVLALIPVFLFFLIFQRYLVDGVATQGLKG